MIVKIGQQTFSTKDLPIAILLSDAEKDWIATQPPKGDGKLGLVCFFPLDVPPSIVEAWIAENASEINIRELGVRYGAIGRVDGTQG